jgi:ribonuclease E
VPDINDTPTPAAESAEAAETDQPAKKTARAAKKAPAKKAAAKSATKKAAAKSATKKTAKKAAAAAADGLPDEAGQASSEAPPAKKASARKTAKKAASTKAVAETAEPAPPDGAAVPVPLFQPPVAKPAKKTAAKKAAKKTAAKKSQGDTPDETAAEAPSTDLSDEAAGGGDDGEGAGRRRRRRGGRRRRKSGEGGDGQGSEDQSSEDGDQPDSSTASEDDAADGSSRRRRRRRRTGEDGDDGDGDGSPTPSRSRSRASRSGDDQITAVSGSTRLEAKKQRRREGREAGRRRAPIVSEAEFLARREAVERLMVIRQRGDLTQIGVLEDKVLVEHYVARESQTSLIGNVYLGRVQNVLPSMEAAFIDIGRGRNAVLYAGEVNWSALGHKDGQPRKIESVLSSGQAVLVQVTKDPAGHKGARLTSQISLAGRFLVYVPDGTTSGISRKLPDTERNRLKTLLKDIVPDTAGVIVRTAAEGASEDELTRDVERLKARWEDIEAKSKGNAPQLLYGEPDLTLKVVRDLFTEDFTKLVIQGDDAWDTVQAYVAHVAPDLQDRLERYDAGENGDLFTAYRVDEQIAKGLDRKVWLPSGGSLVIDRTEAMTVVDVNTGKFTGSGGNLEETVTKNNLEAAEEIVRQLRLRDIGGIIVVDFIDMVLESNRDLVLRRLVECLGRDRTRHQVAEVTSLGLVQMTRKRIGTGLLEAFSETCEHCGGRGVTLHEHPVEQKRAEDDPRRGNRRNRGRGGKAETGNGSGNGNGRTPSPKDIAAMARPEVTHEDASAPHEEDEDAPLSVEEPTEHEAPPEPEPEPDDAPATTEVPEPAPSDEPQATEDVQSDASQEPEPAAEPPKVVSRTRRRSASRPAGPPPTPVASVDGQVPSMGEADNGTGGDVHRELGSPARDGIVEPGTADAEPGPPEPAPVEHVPIKRKGSRKR